MVGTKKKRKREEEAGRNEEKVYRYSNWGTADAERLAFARNRRTITWEEEKRINRKENYYPDILDAKDGEGGELRMYKVKGCGWLPLHDVLKTSAGCQQVLQYEGK